MAGVKNKNTNEPFCGNRSHLLGGVGVVVARCNDRTWNTESADDLIEQNGLYPNLRTSASHSTRMVMEERKHG